MRGIEGRLRAVRNLLFRAAFFGNGCTCTNCGNTYRRFMAQGAKGRLFERHRISGMGYKKNVRCPFCKANHRVRLLQLFFDLRTDIYDRPVRLLHISPHRFLARVLREKSNIDYVSGALYPDRLPHLPTVRVDVTDIDFPDGDFDVVICNHVLEHVREDRQAMDEIFRVLRPGGFSVLQVPLALDLQETLEDPSVVDPAERSRAYGQKDHLRLYGLDYFDRLESAGFHVERDNPFRNEWLPNLAQYRLDEKEDVFIGHKP
jgi:SAM-dependent methyltransferase